MTKNEQKILYAKKFFSAVISKYDQFSNDELLNFCLSILKSVTQKTFFEEEVLKIWFFFKNNPFFALKKKKSKIFKTKENLAEVYIGKSDFFSAAKVLAEIKFNDLYFFLFKLYIKEIFSNFSNFSKNFQ